MCKWVCGSILKWNIGNMKDWSWSEFEYYGPSYGHVRGKKLFIDFNGVLNLINERIEEACILRAYLWVLDQSLTLQGNYQNWWF